MFTENEILLVGAASAIFSVFALLAYLADKLDGKGK